MKYIAFLLAVVGCWGQSTLTLSCPAYRSGTPLICTVSKTGDTPAGLQFTFNADGRAAPYTATILGAAANAGKDTQCGPAACLISGVNAQTIADGQVAQFSIPIPAGVTGNLIFSLSTPIGASLTATAISTTVNPPLSVPSVNKCDITGDGLSDGTDVAAIKNQITSGSAPASSDLNKDGKTDVIDAQILINAAQGRGCTAQ